MFLGHDIEYNPINQDKYEINPKKHNLISLVGFKMLYYNILRR